MNISLIYDPFTKKLQFNGREDYFFTLKQEWGIYLHIQSQIDEVDVQIKETLTEIIEIDKNEKHYQVKKKSINEKIKMQ